MYHMYAYVAREFENGIGHVERKEYSWCLDSLLLQPRRSYHYGISIKHIQFKTHKA